MPEESPTPTYCTADDVRLYTNLAAFTQEVEEEYVITDDQMDAKIVLAERYIDSYAGYWNREAGYSQVRVFPRAEDVANSGVTGTIPEAVKFATIAQVEFMHVNMPDMDHGIEPDASPTKESLSPRAKQLLSGFRRKTGRITLPDAVNPATL